MRLASLACLSSVGLAVSILALVSVDIQLHDTYFVVGHFHYTLVGGSLMLIFASTYYWWPKMTGRFLNEKAGKVGFVLFFIGTLVAFGVMHISGMLGMPRRIPVYREEFAGLNHLTTLGYFFTAAGSLVVFGSILASYFKKPDAKDDAWGVNDVQRSFEWATSSPPPAYNFENIPPIPVVDPT